MIKGFFSYVGTVVDCKSAQARHDVWFVQFVSPDDVCRALQLENPTLEGVAGEENITSGNFKSPLLISAVADATTRNKCLQEVRDDFFRELSYCTFINLPANTQPNAQLDAFIESFGKFETYIIVPYSTTEALAYVKYHSTHSVRTACQANGTTQDPTKIVAYPGYYKPPILQHRFDLKPLVVITAIPGTTRISFKLGNSEITIDMAATSQSRTTLRLPVNLQHTPLPTSYYNNLHRHRLIASVSNMNSSYYTTMMISNLFLSFSKEQKAVTNEIAGQILHEIYFQCEKFGKVYSHQLHPDGNGTAYIQFGHVVDATLAWEFFNNKFFNGNQLEAKLIQQRDFSSVYNVNGLVYDK